MDNNPLPGWLVEGVVENVSNEPKGSDLEVALFRPSHREGSLSQNSRVKQSHDLHIADPHQRDQCAQKRVINKPLTLPSGAAMQGFKKKREKKKKKKKKRS